MLEIYVIELYFLGRHSAVSYSIESFCLGIHFNYVVFLFIKSFVTKTIMRLYGQQR